jgi:hypothetical protein
LAKIERVWFFSQKLFSFRVALIHEAKKGCLLRASERDQRSDVIIARVFYVKLSSKESRRNPRNKERDSARYEELSKRERTDILRPLIVAFVEERFFVCFSKIEFLGKKIAR